VKFLDGKTAPIAWLIAVAPVVLVGMPAELFWHYGPTWLIATVAAWGVITTVIWVLLCAIGKIEP
jgi:hypothetical protein